MRVCALEPITTLLAPMLPAPTSTPPPLPPHDQESSTAETCILYGNPLRTVPSGWGTFRSLIDLSKCDPNFDRYAIGASVRDPKDSAEKIGETYVYPMDFAAPLIDEEIALLGFAGGQLRRGPKSFNLARPPAAAEGGNAAGMHIGANTHGLLDSKRPGETDSAGDMRMGFVQQAKRLSQRVLTGPSTSTQVGWSCVCVCFLYAMVFYVHVNGAREREGERDRGRRCGAEGRQRQKPFG